MEKDKRKFRLKKGAIIPIPGTSKAYSDANITDEIAIEILKANPNRRTIFSKVPENLKELLEQNTEEGSDEVVDKGNDDLVKIGGVELSLEEALEVLKNNDISTKATTVKGVQSKVNKVEKEGTVIVLEKENKGVAIETSETVDEETNATKEGNQDLV